MEPSRTSMEHFEKIASGRKLLNNLLKNSITDIRLYFNYASAQPAFHSLQALLAFAGHL